MTEQEHLERHIALHRGLDELFADFVLHTKPSGRHSEETVWELIKWSHAQTLVPDHDADEGV